MTRSSWMLAIVVWLLPGLAAAQAVDLQSAGPRSRGIERQVRQGLEAGGASVEDGASATVRVRTARMGRRRGWGAEVTLADPSGDEVVSERFQRRTAGQLARTVRRWSEETLAPAVLGMSGASRPAPAPAAEAEPEPEPAARASEDSRDEAPEEAADGDESAGEGVAPFVFSAGVAVTNRTLTYTDDLFAQLRPYTLPAGPFLRLGMEWFPGAHFDSGAFAGFSVGARGEVGLGITSVDGNGTSFPTEVWSIAVDLRYRIPVDPVRLWLEAGYETLTFAMHDADELSPRPQIPNVQYHSLRAGAGFRVDVGLGLFLDVFGAYVQPLAAGEILSDDWFHRGDVMGFDGAAGFGLRVDDVEMAARFAMRRFWYSMNSEPGDARVAGGAVDQYMSGTATFSYAPSGL